VSATRAPSVVALTAQLCGLARPLGLLAFGLLVFALVLLVFGRNPLRAYVDIFSATLGSWYGFSETLVKLIPLVLAALAVALPARIWLINVGGEGQLHAGALFATWGALTFGEWPAWLLLPTMCALGFLGGGLWAVIPGVLRARGWVSETISTLLLNYVAILLVQYARRVHGHLQRPGQGGHRRQRAPRAGGRCPRRHRGFPDQRGAGG
jgi:simple sugar transport system permease protein